MTAEEIKQIIALGEGYNAEFKISVPNKIKDLVEEICAFANSAGGTLFIGVDDFNLIQGVTINNSKRSAIQNSIRDISPPLNCRLEMVIVDGKDIGVIEVESGLKKPYVLSGAIYVRSGPNTQKLTSAEEMRDFFQQADRVYFDEMACEGFNPDEDIDDSNLSEFRTETGISSSVSKEQLLDNLKLFTIDNKFKSGAVLFFGNSPETYYDIAIIRCVAYSGVGKRYISDDKTFTGPLYRQYKQTLNWLKNKLDVSYDIEGAGSGPRTENWEIPETALKEAVINALSHRDYYDKGNRINVELFEDRVEISNPGGLLSAIPEAQFGTKSYSRNPLIFGLFEKMRMVEHVGSGITRMRELMEETGLPHPVFQYSGMFSVSFSRPVDFENWISNWTEKLTENRILILKAIHENSSISKKEIGTVVGLGSTSIDNNIKYLKDKNLIERVGGDRGGKWIIHYRTP